MADSKTIEALKAENEMLLKALGPFSEALESGEGTEPDGTPIWDSPCSMAIDFRDLRAARLAISKATGA